MTVLVEAQTGDRNDDLHDAVIAALHRAELENGEEFTALDLANAMNARSYSVTVDNVEGVLNDLCMDEWYPGLVNRRVYITRLTSGNYKVSW